MIAYRSSEQDGLTIVDGHLEIRKEGQAVARAPYAGTIEEALSSFAPLELFIDQDFSFSGEKIEVEVAISVQPLIDNIVDGKVRIGETTGVWQAEYKGGNAFLAQVPGRPWAQGSPGYGWVIKAPSFLFDQDPVVTQRVGLLIEETLYKLAFGQIDMPGMKRTISNTFNAENPTWTAPLPMVID
jgi:hypothetical protein